MSALDDLDHAAPVLGTQDLAVENALVEPDIGIDIDTVEAVAAVAAAVVKNKATVVAGDRYYVVEVIEGDFWVDSSLQCVGVAHCNLAAAASVYPVAPVDENGGQLESVAGGTVVVCRTGRQIHYSHEVLALEGNPVCKDPCFQHYL